MMQSEEKRKEKKRKKREKTSKLNVTCDLGMSAKSLPHQPCAMKSNGLLINHTSNSNDRIFLFATFGTSSYGMINDFKRKKSDEM